MTRDKPQGIITDAEIERVHGYANFGGQPPREVVNEGVLKYAMGYTVGATALGILREHGLITQPAPLSYQAKLTKKGKAYLRAMFGLLPKDAAWLPLVQCTRATAPEAPTAGDER